MREHSVFGDCPACGARLVLPGDLIRGELLQCDHCGTDLDVIDLGPVALATTLKLDEVWDEYGEIRDQ